MAIYQYFCNKCEKVFDIKKSMSQSGEVECCKCGEEMTRLYSEPGIKFVGKGFYKNDSKS